ncbi:MAG: Fic family protein [Desulfobacterales bacterium]|nr:Fic family protein [Desulfobacterales bacterium]
MERYKHIQFSKHWEITAQSCYQLGECDALVQALSNIPLKPEYRNKLLRLALIKGAQATTAIEGNTLSEEEIEKIQDGWKLPPSKEYQQIEVQNILDAFNALLREILTEAEVHIISPELIKQFHHMIGKNLGEYLDAIPGQFRADSRVVGNYLAPDYRHVPRLVEKLCKWLHEEFRFCEEQNFATALIQSIVTHVYIEWIHPFGDGNGRTGRLLEFYILLRAGLPNIVSHILSNFYNLTRPEYYRQLDSARKESDLTGFIEYAVQGFRDGLRENLRVIQESQFNIFWHNYIYESFANVKYTKREAFKRKRELMLQMPTDRAFSVNEITLLTPHIAKKYAKIKKPTVLRDLKELRGLNLLIKEGRKYRANVGSLKAMMPRKKS